MTGALHGRPTAEELIVATREFLTDVIAPRIEPELRFHVRVAANVLAIVGRELVLGPGQEAEHAVRLADLGFAGDAALADAIRDDRVPPDQEVAVRAAVEADVRARLAVANPHYLEESS
ncbi:hypothetical protein BH11ACT8_BH11ACT8_01070 [soil metagenome]